MRTTSLKPRIRAVPQSDDCGCGYFALSAVYRYYGLSPRDLSLRALLGTDHVAPCGFPICGDWSTSRAIATTGSPSGGSSRVFMILVFLSLQP